jgi:hypothetical protein
VLRPKEAQLRADQARLPGRGKKEDEIDILAPPGFELEPLSK